MKAKSDSHEEDFSISKTQIKKEQKDIEELGKQLVAMHKSSIEKLNLPKPLFDAIIAAKEMSRAALNRQYKFIRKMLAKEDLNPIRHELGLANMKAAKQNAIFHKLEKWRDELIAGNDDIINEVVAINYEVDRQYIRQLIRNAQNELAENKPNKSAKLLFKYLRESVENSTNNY